MAADAALALAAGAALPLAAEAALALAAEAAELAGELAGELPAEAAARRGELAAGARDRLPMALTNTGPYGRVRQKRPGPSMSCLQCCPRVAKPLLNTEDYQRFVFEKLSKLANIATPKPDKSERSVARAVYLRVLLMDANPRTRQGRLTLTRYVRMSPGFNSRISRPQHERCAYNCLPQSVRPLPA